MDVRHESSSRRSISGLGNRDGNHANCASGRYSCGAFFSGRVSLLTVRYPTTAAPRILYRVSRSSNVTQLPPSIYVGDGRWDDPEKKYRVLYAATTIKGALIESLEIFRRDSALEALLSSVRASPGAFPVAPTPMQRSGIVPKAFLSNRYLGSLHVAGLTRIVPVTKSVALALVHARLAPVAARSRVTTISVADILGQVG